MQRRRFLQAAAAGAVGGLTPVRDAVAQMHGMPGMGMGGPISRVPTSWAWVEGLPLRGAASLENSSTEPGTFHGTLVAAPYLASVVSGLVTELWGYNGAYPGPLIELQEGQRVKIDLFNRLGLDSNVHWHGLPVPSEQDGNPMDAVAPGAARQYAFDVPVGSAGTYWYHPHAHRTVTLQTGHGLLGPLIVRSANDPLAHLPEMTMMISSLSLDGSGQISASVGASGGGMAGMMMMASPDPLLVNGQKLPVHAMAPGTTQRWRILNGTADRYLRLGLDDHQFAVVGTDGGLLEQPILDLTEWLLAPAQRVEIVVTISSQAAARYTFRDLGYSGGMSAGAGEALFTVETGWSPGQGTNALPDALRSFADLGPATSRQRVVLSGAGMGMMGRFLINGRSFDMDRIDFQTVVGRVELWDLVNASAMDHPIHIHGTQFYVVGQTEKGAPVSVPHRAWLDTVNVPAGETITIKIRQSMAGKRMVHCHILPHEDAGMMAVLDVQADVPVHLG